MVVGSSAGTAQPGVVLAHDYLTEMGGAERVVAALVRHFPGAPLLTSGFRPAAVDEVFRGADVRTSGMGPLLADKRRAKLLFPLLPVAFESIQVPPCDVLLTSTSGFAHHLRAPAGSVHIAYCHTPPRFLWDQEAYFRGWPLVRVALQPWLELLRALDRLAMRRVTTLIANSRHTAARVQEIYGRAAQVLPPPVDVSAFRPGNDRSGRFLVVSRLLRYKRIGLAVRAATVAGLPLDAIGEGPDRSRLEALAGPTVRFLGRRPDSEVREALAACVALVVPGVEDFGLTVVEAQASGRPPVAAAAGGALETIRDGETGFLVGDASPTAFAAAMERAALQHLPADALVEAAHRYDERAYTDGLDALIAKALEQRRRVPSPAFAGALVKSR
jgi:glycosyltransferase involved in cell wall biosynthesis